MSEQPGGGRDSITRSTIDLTVASAKVAGVSFVVGLVVGFLVRATDSPDTNVLTFALVLSAAVGLAFLAIRLGVILAVWLASKGILFHVVGIGLLVAGLTLTFAIPILGNGDDEELATGDIVGYAVVGAPVAVLGAAMLWTALRRP